MSANNYHLILKSLTNNIITIGILSHVITCLWIRVNVTLTNNWVADYVTSLYFLFATSSTVGYGDITVDHKSREHVEGRYLFASCLIIAALIFFAYLQSLINSLIHQFQAVELVIHQELDEFSDWMAARNQTKGVYITFKYEATLKEFINYITTHDVFNALNSGGFIENMSYSHKDTIVDSASLFITKNFTFFEELSAQISQEIVLGLERHR